MANKNFLLLSMDDSKIKRISNVISNESCRKILDYLSNKEATETELAEKLGIPISTVHYNLQQLIQTGLISAEEYHYSPKGKEVSHYKLANKYIIIAPKTTFGIKEKLKSILPVALIVAATAGVIQFFTRYSIAGIAQDKMMAAKSTIVESATAPAASSQQIVSNITQSQPNLALWFLTGSLFALLVYFVVSLFRKER